jgi:DNA-directed RNA polymerase specialized sigma24 family protein
MTSNGSVTYWIGQLKAGDAAAAQPLFERYFARMVRLARARLRGRPGRVANEEDAASEAFASFCRRAEQGKFPQLKDSDDLWRLLVVITARKVIDQVERARRQKAGGGKVRGESAWGDGGIEEVIGAEPTPAFAAQTAEEYQRLLALLPDDTWRQVAVWKLEGNTNAEIAAKLPCVERTVERKLDVIRSLWQEYRDEGRHGKK